MLKEKKILIFGSAFVILTIGIMITLTYAFFTAGVEGNDTANDTEATTGTLRLRFSEGPTIGVYDAYPGRSETKTFTVENIGDSAASYNINFTNMSSTFINDELVYILTSTNDGGTVSETVVPSIDTTISRNIIIDTDVTQTYTLTIIFKETGSNQNSNQGARFTGKIEIVPTRVGGLLAGYLRNGQNQVLANQKIMLHSDPITATTDEEGYYEFKNVPAGEHTISVLDSNDEVISSKNVMVELSNRVQINNSILRVSPILTKYINIEVSDNDINLTAVAPVLNVKDTIINAEVAMSDSIINFNRNSTHNAEKGLYYTADATTYGEDGEQIYYYRGDVDNNWVSFGGYYWRIVRTTAEGGVKMIYSGGNTNTGVTSLTDTSGLITNGASFGINYNSKYYVGYSTSTGLDSWSGEQSNSNIKNNIDTWYISSSITELEKTYLSDTAVYCNDRSNNSEDETQIFYEGYNRLEINKRPTFVCNSVNGSRYTKTFNSVKNDNGYLTYPVATLSVDEAYYAGLAYGGEASTSPYIMDNALGYWWTMTPYLWNGVAYEFAVNIRGSVSTNGVDGTSFKARPVVAVKECVTVISGDGSKEMPYVLSNAEC